MIAAKNNYDKTKSSVTKTFFSPLTFAFLTPFFLFFSYRSVIFCLWEASCLFWPLSIIFLFLIFFLGEGGRGAGGGGGYSCTLNFERHE